MLKRIFISLVCGACLIAALTSCGDSKASGTGEFATVFATASPGVSNLESDVATWVDATGAAATACSADAFATVTSDNVAYNIISTPYTSANTGSSSPIVNSNLVITRVTFTLTPADSSTPALPPKYYQTQYFSTGFTIPPTATATPVNVRIVSDELKKYLFESLDLNCGNPGAIYNYRATVSFEAQEVTTQRVSTITAPGFLLVSIADRADK